MNKSILYVCLLVTAGLMSSGCFCYSFKGISIPPDINTFYVGNFKNKTVAAPVDIEVQFSETLRSKIRNESRLKYQEQEPDILFEGDVVGFNISAEAPQEGNTVALNKLDISVSVKYTNSKNEKLNYTKSFNFFQTYPGDQDLSSVQDDLIKKIFNQLVERIFNDTFTTW